MQVYLKLNSFFIVFLLILLQIVEFFKAQKFQQTHFLT